MDNPLFLRKEQALTEWVLVLQMKERNVLMISIDCWGVRLVCPFQSPSAGGGSHLECDGHYSL
jgi:hypothetical protein